MGLCICFHQLPEEFALMMIGLGTDLRVQQNIIQNQFFPILGLWAIQPPVPGHLGSVIHGLPLIARASNQTSHFLKSKIHFNNYQT